MKFKSIVVVALLLLSVISPVLAEAISSEKADDDANSLHRKEKLDIFDQLNIKFGVLGLKGKKRAQKLLSMAKEYNEAREYEVALQLLSGVIGLNTTDKLNWTATKIRVKIYKMHKQLDDAIEAYSEYIRVSEPGIHQALAYSYRAELYEITGKLKKAQDDRAKLNDLLL